MIKTDNKEINYLLQLLYCALKEQPAPIDEAVDMDKLFRLAKRQQVYTTVLPALEAGGVLSQEQLAQWNDYRKTELQKLITVDAERAAICSELDALGIPYMFLKGLEIREYYPKIAMRQMSDNDILYDASRREELMALMKKHGYYLGASGGISDDFYKKPFCTFEFHRTLFNPEEPFCPDFDPMAHAVPYGEGSSRMVISREDNYLYAVGHLYKHYYCIDGCGVRFICDLYLLAHSDDVLDWDYIHAELKRFGIAQFNEIALSLADAIFEDAALTEDAKALLDFMLEGGIFGTDSFDINSEVEQYGSKAAFLYHRLFPSREHMQAEYRTLKRKPYLLPYYYGYRLVDKYRHNRRYMQRDLDALKQSKKKNEDK